MYNHNRKCLYVKYIRKIKEQISQEWNIQHGGNIDPTLHVIYNMSHDYITYILHIYIYCTKPDISNSSINVIYTRVTGQCYHTIV